MSSNIKENSFPFHGNSMFPFILHGSLVNIESVPVELYRRGDIICFIQNPPAVFAHRLISIIRKNKEKCFVEKGDNVYGFSNVPVDKILGRLIKIDQPKGIYYMNSSYWKVMNYFLALIGYLQVILLKLIPYSYHSDSVPKRIPHYLLKIIFRIFLRLSLILYKPEKPGVPKK